MAESCYRLWQCFHAQYDRVAVYTRLRWTFTISVLAAYVTRVYISEGYHIISYALAIYFLSAFISFLTPKLANVDMEEDDNPVLPTNEKDEFRPFVRQLPEMKFWEGVTLWSFIAFLCTFSETMNIPVFWPILIFYFLVLLVFTLKRQIAHMSKHNYVPWNVGKRVYL